MSLDSGAGQAGALLRPLATMFILPWFQYSYVKHGHDVLNSSVSVGIVILSNDYWYQWLVISYCTKRGSKHMVQIGILNLKKC